MILNFRMISMFVIVNLEGISYRMCRYIYDLRPNKISQV